MPKEQNGSDIHELKRDFRNNSTFRKLLRACDKDASRRVVDAYIEWLCNDIKEGGR